MSDLGEIIDRVVAASDRIEAMRVLTDFARLFDTSKEKVSDPVWCDYEVMVTSETTDGIYYLVRWQFDGTNANRTKNWRCECPDFSHRGGDNYVCKHIRSLQK